MTPLVLVRGAAYLAMPLVLGLASMQCRRARAAARESHSADSDERDEITPRPTRAQMKERRTFLEAGGDPRRVDLRYCNLDRARLAGMRFDGVDMSHASLNGASLEESRLIGTTLDYADLSKADLRKADLSQTSVLETNLWKADLRGANLAGCRGIAMANLRGAKYDMVTRWPSRFDPAESGAIRIRSSESAL